jgi:hypothetical protein
MTEAMQAEWIERRKKYKPRTFDNVNQQSIEDYLISALIAWGDNQGVGAYNKMIFDKGIWQIGRKEAKSYSSCAAYQKERRPKMKQCYYNSQMFVVFDCHSGAKYYEGYVCDGFFAMQHGWVVMPDGNVVDFTLEARDRYFKRKKANREGISITDVAYFGVEIPAEFVRKKIVEIKCCTLIAHAYYLNDNRLFMLD